MTSKIDPKLKLALELGPIVLFFMGYKFFKNQTFQVFGADYSGFIVMTAVLVVMIVISSAILWRLTGSLSRMQLMTLVLVVVMGGLSVYLNDERFIKMKPTALYLGFGSILGFGLMRGESYLRLVMEEAVPMQPEGWMKLTRRFCVFFFAIAAANEFVWRNFSTDIWVDFKVWGFVPLTALFAVIQVMLLQKYVIEEDQK